MSVDKLRRALLAQKQRLDGAQQQQDKQTAGYSSTPTASQPVNKQTKRKAQTQEIVGEEGKHGSRRGSSSEAETTKSSRSNPTAPLAVNPKQPSPSSHKKHKASDNTTTPSSTTPQSHKPSSTLSALSTKLASSRFRWLNEQLYTLPSAAAFAHFSAHPADYEAYHTGFRQQVQRWPSHPLDSIIARLQSLTTPHTIADMGCGDARIATTLALATHTPRHTVHSFDLVPASPLVTPANIAHTPLPSRSVDVLVYCLSLMPTDYAAVLGEGMRVLRAGGEMVVAEVSSRLVEGGGVEGFVRGLEAMGLKRRKIVENNYFTLVWCTKEGGAEGKESGKSRKGKGSGGGSGGGRKGEKDVAKVVLTPCIYKKR